MYLLCFEHTYGCVIFNIDFHHIYNLCSVIKNKTAIQFAVFSTNIALCFIYVQFNRFEWIAAWYYGMFFTINITRFCIIVLRISDYCIMHVAVPLAAGFEYEGYENKKHLKSILPRIWNVCLLARSSIYNAQFVVSSLFPTISGWAQPPYVRDLKTTSITLKGFVTVKF